MKRWIIILVIVAMAGWTIYEFVLDSGAEAELKKEIQSENASGNNADLEVGLEKGKLAPDFELETLAGETVKLSDFRGKPVMLNFWATWCPPCRAEIPDMQKFYENEDVTILAVNAFETEKSMDTVEQFVDEFGMTFDVLIDDNSKAVTIYNIFSFPTTFMIDSNGVVQNMAPGALNYEQMVQEFNKMN